jgi:UDP-N-acetylmuramoyl-tripeptide--D-alanyl-D-alanine ligase
MRRKFQVAAKLFWYRLVLLTAFCWRRLMFRTRFIVITGSVGKTTAKNLLAALLADMPARTLSTRHSSNDVKHIARDLLRVRPWHRFVVLEAGTDQPGWIRRSAWLTGPDIAIILAVARTHTTSFHTLDDTAKEKASLLRGLRRNGVAILNEDDPRVAAMAAKCRSRIIRFGCAPKADVRARNVSSQWPERLSLSIETREGSHQIRTQLVGTHWTPSVLAASAAALECGMPLHQVAELISRVPPTTARMEPAILRCGAVILRDDVNGSLHTFLAAFETLKNAQAQRKILVITTVGDSPESWGRRLDRIAAAASKVVDMLILVGKKRDTKRAGKAAVVGGLAAEGLHQFEHLRDVATFLQDTLRIGDLLLLRGRMGDHLARLYHAQLREVACWKDGCGKKTLCDYCPELFPELNAVKTGNQGALF